MEGKEMTVEEDSDKKCIHLWQCGQRMMMLRIRSGEGE
jgi:hypothetical protein